VRDNLEHAADVSAGFSARFGYPWAIFGLTFSLYALIRLFFEAEISRTWRVWELAICLAFGILGLLLVLRDLRIRKVRFRTWKPGPEVLDRGCWLVALSILILTLGVAQYVVSSIRNNNFMVSEGELGLDALVGGITIAVLVWGLALIWIARQRSKNQTTDTTIKMTGGDSKE
jgi:hypothetical protein